MEHIITQLAHEVAEKHSAIEGDLVVTPSDDLFWFHRPQIVIFLIHFILFQNAFEIAYFFWILVSGKKIVFLQLWLEVQLTTAYVSMFSFIIDILVQSNCLIIALKKYVLLFFFHIEFFL